MKHKMAREGFISYYARVRDVRSQLKKEVMTRYHNSPPSPPHVQAPSYRGYFFCFRVCISIRSLLGTEYGEGGPKPNGAEVHLCPQKKQGHSLYCEMLLNLNRFISTIHHDGVEENLFLSLFISSSSSSVFLGMPARCCFFTDRDARVTRWRNLEHRWCAQVWPGTLSLSFSFCFRSHLPSAEKGNLPSIRSNRRLLTAHREITTIHNKLRSDPKQVIQTKQGKNAQPFISMITRNTTWGPKSNLIHIQMRQSTCPIGVPPPLLGTSCPGLLSKVKH